MSNFKIAAYLRVSTEEQAALVDGSLDNQKYRLSAFVDLKNVQETKWGNIVDFYIDDGYSAKDTRRPAFQRMMADVRKGKINLILVADLSRLSRSISDFCVILDMLKEYESSFLSIKEQFDSSTPSGKMMLYNMINLAQFEREQTAERVALGCHARAMRGLLNGGYPILGYDKSPDKKSTYVVNELEAAQVRAIFDEFLKIGTIGRTTTRLNELGIKPKVHQKKRQRLMDKGIWGHDALGALLKNYAYIGMREINKRNANVSDKNLKAHEKHQIVKGTWPAIVDEMTFQSAQALIKENQLKERRRLDGAERRVFIASGLVFCQECGRAMVGQSSHGEVSIHRYYQHARSKGDVIQCSVNRVKAEVIEESLSNNIFKLLNDGGYLDNLTKGIAAIEKGKNSASILSKKNLEKELQEIEADMNNAFRFQAKAESSPEALSFFTEKIETLGLRKKQIIESISKLKEHDSVVSFDEVKRNLDERVSVIAKGWAKMPSIQKRNALKRLIHKVEINKQGIGIYYYFNSLKDERTLGTLLVEKSRAAKVISLDNNGNHVNRDFRGSKQSSAICAMTKLVTQVHKYPNLRNTLESLISVSQKDQIIPRK